MQSEYTEQQRSGIRYAILQREVDSNRELYDAFLQRYKEVGVAGVGANNISIVDLAQVPGGPTSPKISVNLALSLLIGLSISVFVLFIARQIDHRLVLERGIEVARLRHGAPAA